MSFSMTPDAIRNRTKTVTRRQAWWHLKPGTLLCAVEKAQGLRKGEKVVRLGVIRVLRVDWEPLDTFFEYGSEECAREGFPELTPNGFIDMFCRANGFDPNLSHLAWVNRIEFEYVDGDA
jgi:hypothetical protein